MMVNFKTGVYMFSKSKIIFSAGLLFLTSCTLPVVSSSSGTTGASPIYQGMTVSGLSSQQGLQTRLSSNEINQENPFDLPEGEWIENKIESDLEGQLSFEPLDYYANPNEIVRITINIQNPQSYVILSFNLNGRRYQSFEFKEGSTSTKLLMDVTLQSIPGVQSLTIDEIKYIVDSEGENQIRDVVMFGDQTVDVGVGYQTLPNIEVTNFSILPTSVEYEFVLSDNQNLLSEENAGAFFYFYNGEELIKEKLILGSNIVTFDHLNSKTLYQYALTTLFNPLDGDGISINITSKQAFYTSSFLQVEVIPFKETLDYEVNVINGAEIGQINSVELLKGDEVVESSSELQGIFTSLLSDNDFLLRVSYDYQFEPEGDLYTEVFELTVRTLAKATPTFAFTDVNPGQEDIIFEYEVVDEDEVGSLTKIELVKDGEVVETLTEFEDTSFIDLLSNNDYTLKATYTYDLNDGLGSQDLEISSPTKTLPKSVPNLTMRIENVFSNSIEIDLNFEDPDSTLLSFQTMLLNTEGGLVENKINDPAPIFSNLNSFTQYEIKIEYRYVNNETTENTEILNTEIRQIKTAPESITIDSVTYLTNNTIQINGEVLVQLTIDNPSSVDLKYVISGDNYFEVNKNLSSSEIVVFKYIDNTIGGQFTFKIDGFIFTDEQEEMDLLPINEFEFNIRVLGTISIVDLMVITNNQYINVVSEDSNSLIKIWLNNPSEYDVFSMVLQQTNIETLNDSQFEMSKDKQIITLTWTGSKQFQSYQGAYNIAFLVLRSLTYGFDEQSTSVINFEINHFVIRPIPIVPSLNPLPIYTYEDLISINTFGSYYLANDLDLINVNHSTPINFKGFFDGRGHTIKNLRMMNISSAISTNEVMLGLFGRIEGHFQNLVLENSNLYLDYKQPLFLGVFAGNMQKGNVFNIEIKGEHTIYAASSARIYFGNLIGSLSDNGSLYASKVYGTYNTTIKSSSKLDDGRPRIGGIIGVNSGRSIESNILDATLNYNFEFVSHTDRYAVGYLFGGLSAVENGGEFAYNIVKGTINLIDNTTITNQTVNIGGMIARIGNKQSHNVFLAEMNIKTPGYLTVSGFYGHYGSLNFVHNFIFGGKITIQAGQRENWGYILPDQASATKVFNNNYILDGASITNVTNDSVIAKVILSGNLPNNYNVPYFQIDSFSTSNGLEINQLNFTHFSIIVSIIESINLIDENTTQEIIDSIKAEISQLSEYEKSLVYNKAHLE